MNFLDKITSSNKELKNVKSLTIMSMLLGMGIVLSFLNIDVPFMRISLSFVAIALIGMLYGPVAAGICGGLCDVLAFVIRPTGAYFFGFTFNAILAGVLYGFFFYKNNGSLIRVTISRTFISLFCHVVLNTFWLSLLYGKGFMVLIGPRFIKNIIALPIEIGVLFFVLNVVLKLMHDKNSFSLK